MKKIIPRGATLIPDNASCVFEGEIFDVYQWPQQMFDGSTETFEMLKRPDTVTVIPIVGERIITIEDEQPHTGLRMSFPGGRVDVADLSTLDAAEREIKEETGYEFSNWKLVNIVQPHAKLEWFIYFYVAWDGRKVAQPYLDAGEKIKPRLFNFGQAKDLVINKSGYLGESVEVFSRVDSTEALIKLPEFQGWRVNR